MENHVLEHILDGREEPSNLPFELLKKITNNFSEEREIGQGGFATVYKVINFNKIMNMAVFNFPKSPTFFALKTVPPLTENASQYKNFHPFPQLNAYCVYFHVFKKKGKYSVQNTFFGGITKTPPKNILSNFKKKM